MIDDVRRDVESSSRLLVFFEIPFLRIADAQNASSCFCLVFLRKMSLEDRRHTNEVFV